MKHYPWHIGDFDRATRHLTRIERSIYRDLIDLYMDTEQELTLDLAKLKRRVLAHSNEESTAVEQVLNEFFTETPTGWFHSRCDVEIEAYQANTSQKAMAGKASAAAKALKKLHVLNGAATPVEHPFKSVETKSNGTPTNHQPSTINHQPINKGTPDGFVAFWGRYPKKTAKPAALKAFKAQKINGELPDILADITRKAASPDWQKEGGQFIPNPATYLNQRRWEDQTGQQTTDIWAGAI